MARHRHALRQDPEEQPRWPPGGASGVPESEEFFFAGGGGLRAGEMAAEKVVAGLVVVGPVLGLGEVEGVGAKGDDAAGRGVQGSGVRVVVAVALGEEDGAGAGPDRGGPFGVGVGVAAEAGGLLPGDEFVVEADDFRICGNVAFSGAGGCR
ncbi:hypothetical protein [Streptomyces nodosus]|uniref:hypothetical protein n=1 Tax=Streptomyces nodosus TaxID=40318 RepID=UPI0037F49BD2